MSCRALRHGGFLFHAVNAYHSFEIAFVLVRFNHVASVIKRGSPHHVIECELRVFDCVRLAIPETTASISP